MNSKLSLNFLQNPALFLVSLGCAKNLVDTEVIAGQLLSRGCELVFDSEDADLMLINSCAFLPSAREEAYRAIEDGIDWKTRRPGRILVVSGCLTEFDREGKVKEQYPEVDLWTGVNQIPEIADLLAGKKPQTAPRQPPSFLADHTAPKLQLTVPHAAYLKISDGCNNRCSYCAIPHLRGALRSRPLSSVVTEAKQMIANGVKELLVIAQDVTAYGMDRPQDGEDIVLLLEKLNELEGDFAIRLLYTHPAHYTEKFIAFMARTDTKVLPYLDIPLQHISERILASQNRHVTRERIEEILQQLKRRIPNLVLRTTFIAGLPGETAEEFHDLLAFVKRIRFDRCGVFPFSAEPGTPAAAMPDQVPARTAKTRANKLMKLQTEIMLEKNRDMVGKTVRVLVDAIDGKTAIGRGPADAPDIDNCIRILNGGKLQPGDWTEVKITGADYYELTGKTTVSGGKTKKGKSGK